MNESFLGGLHDPLPTTQAEQTVEYQLPALSAALALDVALEADTFDGLCNKYRLTPIEFQRILQHPAFQQTVSEMKSEIQSRGVTFRMKATIQADMYLQTVHKMVMNEETPPSVRADLIKQVVKWGDLEPKNSKSDGETSQKFNLVINIPGMQQPPSMVIESK